MIVIRMFHNDLSEIHSYRIERLNFELHGLKY